MNVIHNTAHNRFEVALEGRKRAELTYILKPKTLTITHTYVPPAFEGRGIAGELTKAALNYAVNEGLEVIPLCSYAVRYIARQNRRVQNA